MAEDNKVISFGLLKSKRKKNEYFLKTKISIYMCKNSQNCKIEISLPLGDKISTSEIFIILKLIYKDLKQKVSEKQVDPKENFEVNFTLLYYENTRDPMDFKYMCIQQDISKEKLAEYLFIINALYKNKK